MRHQLDGLISYFVKSLDEGFERTISEIQTYCYSHYSKNNEMHFSSGYFIMRYIYPLYTITNYEGFISIEHTPNI